MLTAKEEEVDKVLGLSLAPMITSQSRSARGTDGKDKGEHQENGDGRVAATRTNVIQAKDLVIDCDRYEVKRDGTVVELTLREFELVRFLAMHPGQIFTRENLLEKVWGYEYYGDVRTVDVTVRRVREKLERDPSNCEYILTKRGVGSYFDKPEE